MKDKKRKKQQQQQQQQKGGEATRFEIKMTQFASMTFAIMTLWIWTYSAVTSAFTIPKEYVGTANYPVDMVGTRKHSSGSPLFATPPAPRQPRRMLKKVRRERNS